MESTTIITAQTPAHYQAFKSLLHAYFHGASIEAARHWGQGFDADALLKRVMAEVSVFDPPDGRLYLAVINDEIIGCCGLKPLTGTIGEVKRLYVYPDNRGKGVGRQLVSTVINAARQIGYAALRLDNPDFMVAANRLYRSLGFVEIDPYPESGLQGEMVRRYHFMELILGRNP